MYLATRQTIVLPVMWRSIATEFPCKHPQLFKDGGNYRILHPYRHGAATLVADTQQHSPKSAGMAPQPYAAAIASLMVARRLGQMDWDFQ